jgi:hypothetical protein
LFADSARAQQVISSLERQPWRGEWALLQPGAEPMPVAVRAESVPGRDGRSMGVIVALTDLRGLRRTAQARRALEGALAQVGTMVQGSPADGVVGAILTNASLAAMDVAEATGGPPVAPLLAELEASARRATVLYEQVQRLRH